MKVTIIGAGAIGGLAGAHMSRAGYDVTLVDRWVEHVEAMNRTGITIDGVRGDMHMNVKALLPEQLQGPLEAILIATKSQHTADAVRLVIPHMGPDSFIVSYQNGFNEPLIAELLTEAGLCCSGGGMERVIGCIPNYGGALVDPGHLEFVHEGKIELGEMNGADTPRLRELTTMLETLTKVVVSSNIWGQIWAKQVYANQVIFSALVDARIHETLGVERYARIAGAVVREGIGIAAANGIELEAFDFFDPVAYQPKTAEDTQKLIANINTAIWLLRKDQDPTKHQFKKQGSGMWWDIVYRKRKSETEAQNTRLVAYGQAKGADTRLIEKMSSMIYEIEDGKRQLGFHNYIELEAYVAEIGKTLP
jgi:2-dehydropantoate 2-reductase